MSEKKKRIALDKAYFERIAAQLEAAENANDLKEQHHLHAEIHSIVLHTESAKLRRKAAKRNAGGF